jgi:cytochrome c oxidase assembly factor CtaG
VITLATILPPGATYARQYAFAQALQFDAFGVIIPALLALGTPPRIAVRRDRASPRIAARVSPAVVAAGRLIPFVALVIIWRLPPLLDALASYPAVSVAELVTLVGAGLGVWLAISGRAAPVTLPRPLRAAMAAVAMWTIWIIGYVTGMSSLALIPRNPALTEVVSAAVDRQLAAAALWAGPAICFVPLIYYLLVSWLGEREEPGDDQCEPSGGADAGLIPARRPPGGWRHRGAR